ncbi:Paf1-domain-containing protein [Rhizodiscina lignyota]|uniref:Paf1-domain-containing protein n=1 Tax=Rhizodiscina lignyota TaxID=1504668 RepID=A0A9P4M785_9PEZI|nr:Paf1-domain-containing protein [Rhizodiscina lignyota]
MTSSAARPDRGYHQDYIARIRYSNALPPPPNPPKLLDIPNTGLASGQYTSAGFASRLHREQPLNIEADAEMGMHIDLVGIPGVFEGDESAINPSTDVVIPPQDRALLRPLASLGKPTSSTAGISFLRRTEYLTSLSHTKPHNASAASGLRNNKAPQRKKRVDANKEEPLQIAKGIVKGFDVAYPADAYTGPDDGTHIRGAEITTAEKEAWARPRHPRKGDAVRLVDSYPLLPDWDAIPQTQDGVPSAFATFKFITNPTGKTDSYDERLDVAILRQRNELPEEERAIMAERNAAYEKDPVNNDRYLPKAEYTFFLPDESTNVRGVKRKFDVFDPEKDDDALYGTTGDDDDLGLGEEKTSFRYNNIRIYSTYQQRVNLEDPYECVAIALHDPEDESRLEKGAYFYPIAQQSNIRQKGAVG